MSAVSPARRVAFQILKAVEQGHAHSDDMLRGRDVEALSEPDRRLTTALVLGVLRWQIELDQRIRLLLKHPNAKLDAPVLIALRLGAFQLLHLDRVPARAAIDESVEIAKKAGHRFASSMVNAVLRKLAATRADLTEAESTDDHCAGHPAWMVDRWTAAYGEQIACAICRHGQTEPNLTLRISGEGVGEEIEVEGIALQPGQILRAARQAVSGDVMRTAAFREGRVRIQDEGSQLVAELAPRGERILDCCAAPGGKTLILAERNPSALRIVANESSSQRLEQMQSRLACLGERIQFRLGDATKLDDDAAFDVVLADVPCSGTGTLGRNPEIRHRLRLEDIPRQAERQRAILASALRALRPGGYVLYSTCSLEPEENEQVVAAVLADHTNARLIPLQSRIEQLRVEGVLTQAGNDALIESLTTEGCLRLVPGSLQSDGFFAALIEKTA